MESTGAIIHPTAEVSSLAIIGAGTRIWNHCQVRENACIGNGSILGKDVYVDSGVRVGDNVKIQNGAFLYHGTTIESGVFIGPGVIFTNDKQPRAINPDGTLKGNADWEVGTIHVGYGASIGAGAIILPDVRIGRYAMVGAGSIVTRDIPEHALVYGNPARQAGYVCRCGTQLAEQSSGQFRCPECGEQHRFNFSRI